MRTKLKLEPKVVTQTTLKTRLIKYGGGGLAILTVIGAIMWFYLQVGDQEQSMASTGGIAPANDTKSGAVWLTDLYEDQSAFAAFTNENATTDAVSGSCFNSGSGQGVWFKFKALYSDATITVKTGSALGSIQNLEIALFDAADNEVSCAVASGSSFATITTSTLTADSWYYLLVNSKTSADTGTFTLYINNVSPVKYYIRKDDDWNKASTWSTSGYGGSAASSVPGKANVVFIKDADGDVKIDNYTAECAGLILTSGSKKSKLNIKSNGALKVYGMLYMDDSGNKDLEIKAEDGSIYVQDSLLYAKSGNSEESKIKLKRSTLQIDQSLTMKHSGGKKAKIESEDNCTLTVAGNVSLINDGGTEGIEFKADRTDINISGDLLIDDISGSGTVKFEYKKDKSLTVSGDMQISQNGSTGNVEVKIEDNVNVHVLGNASVTMDGGSSDLKFNFKKNTSFTVDGDLLLRQTGGSNTLLFEAGSSSGSEKDSLIVGGDFSFGADDGDASNFSLDGKFYKSSKFLLSGNLTALTSKGRLDFNDPQARLVLTGSQVQNIQGESLSGSLIVKYQNIAVKNSYASSPDTAASVIFSAPLKLEEKLDLIDGIVRISNSGSITFAQNMTLAGGSDSSYINGAVVKEGSYNMLIPLGDEGVYAPLELKDYSNSSSTNKFTVQYFRDPYPDTALAAGLVKISNIEYWKVEKNSGTSNLKVKIILHWQDGTSEGISDLNDLAIARYDGSEWVAVQPTSINGTVTQGSIETNYGQGGFGPYTFGSIGGGNVLPIKLNYFSVELQDNQEVLLSWETAMEHNNDFFTIERSYDGQIFEEIATVRGAGNSDLPLSYTYVDETPGSGNIYYRLKQTDYDGQFEYFNVEQVYIEPISSSMKIQEVYPVPFADQMTIILESGIDAEVRIDLITMNGSQIPLMVADVHSGRNSIYLGDLDHLPKGTYVLTVTSSDKQISTKVMKAR